MGMYADPADCVQKQRLWLLSKDLEGMCEKGPERLTCWFCPNVHLQRPPRVKFCSRKKPKFVAIPSKLYKD